MWQLKHSLSEAKQWGSCQRHLPSLNINVILFKNPSLFSFEFLFMASAKWLCCWILGPGAVFRALLWLLRQSADNWLDEFQDAALLFPGGDQLHWI